MGDLSSRDVTERPPLFAEAVLLARLAWVKDADSSPFVPDDTFSESEGVISFFLFCLGFLTSVSRGLRLGSSLWTTSTISTDGEGARSLIGLTSPGRGRTGEPGDRNNSMLRRGGFFQGVRDPVLAVSIDKPVGRLVDGARGVVYLPGAGVT